MKEFKVQVDEKVCSELESLSYEVESMNSIIKGIITDNPNNNNILNSAIFAEYSHRYTEKFKEYEVMKKMMQDANIPLEVRSSGNLVKWDLDFHTGILTYSVS